jgi:hypothetical protein
VAGTVKAVDPAKKTLTLVTRPARGDDAAEERTLTLSGDGVLLLDDGKGRRLSLKAGKLDDVPVGSAASAKLSLDQAAVMNLRIEGPTHSGLLKAVDPDKGTIILAIPRGRDDAEEKTFTLPKDVRVMIDGHAAKLSDVKVGDNPAGLQLRMTLDQKAVQAVIVWQGRGR